MHFQYNAQSQSRTQAQIHSAKTEKSLLLMMKTADRLFLLLRLGTLDLRRTPQSLLSVLALLACDIPVGSAFFISQDERLRIVSTEPRLSLLLLWDVRWCLDALSGFLPIPTRTNLYRGSNFFMASGES